MPRGTWEGYRVGDRVRVVYDASDYYMCEGTVVGFIGERSIEVRPDGTREVLSFAYDTSLVRIGFSLPTSRPVSPIFINFNPRKETCL